MKRAAKGVWGHAPQEILNFWPSEIVSRAVLGQNSRRPVKLEVLNLKNNYVCTTNKVAIK